MTPDVETLREALKKGAWLCENGTESQAVKWALKNDPLVIAHMFDAARKWADVADPSPETVERVAKAIYGAFADAMNRPRGWEGLPAYEREQFHHEARAVLAALVAPQDTGGES